MTQESSLPTPGEAEGDRATVEADLLVQDSRRLAGAKPSDSREAAGLADNALPNPSQAEGERGGANAPAGPK